MPSLKLAWVSTTKSTSLMPSISVLNVFMCGTLASPTPTMPTSSDSIRRTEVPRPRYVASTAAAIQPALPPPTTTSFLMRLSVLIAANSPPRHRPMDCPGDDRRSLRRHRRIGP
jgi:hypothetical protein